MRAWSPFVATFVIAISACGGQPSSAASPASGSVEAAETLPTAAQPVAGAIPDGDPPSSKPSPRSAVECHDLLPSSLPRGVDVDLAEDVLDGTSDASGEAFLFTTAPEGVASPTRAYHFVRVRDRTAQETSVHRIPYRNDLSTYSVGRRGESQPAGFEIIRSQLVSAPGAGTSPYVYDVFDVFAPDGTLLNPAVGMIDLVAGEGFQSVEYRIAPAGGTAMIRRVWRTGGGVSVHYGRFDPRGDVAVASVPLDLGGSALVTWGVDRGGDVLLIAAQGPGGYGTHPLSARWLDASGTPVTGWFAVGDTYVRNPFLLELTDGLALGDRDGYFPFRASYSHVFLGRAAAAQAVPDWLVQRADQQLAIVRGGRAYAAWSVLDPDDAALAGLGQGACAGGLDVLTSAGASCGCVPLPEVAPGVALAGIGRDGSIILRRFQSATFQVYPGAFR